MKATVVLFFLFLIAVPLVSAEIDECRYTDVETYYEDDVVLTYEDSNVIGGQAPIFSDFANGTRSSFMVFNPNDFEMTIMFNYTVEGHGGGVKNYGIKVPPNDYAKVKENCYADDTPGDCTIVEDSVQYFILKPKIMYPRLYNAAKTRDVCGKPCTVDSECGTGICNRMNYCDKVKDVACVDGKQTCNNTRFCRSPSIKNSGEAYSCEWECQSGAGVDGICKWNDRHSCTQPTDCLSGICNFAGYCGEFIDCPNGTQNCNDKLCVTPSNKSVGEAYSCAWECMSGSGKNGICKDSFFTTFKRIFTFIIILGLMFAVIRFFILRGTDIALERQQLLVAINKEIEMAEKKYENLFEENTKLIKDLDAQMGKIKTYNLELKKLEKKKEHADDEAKMIVEAQIAKIKADNRESYQQVSKEKAQIEQEEKRIKDSKNNLINLRLELNAVEFGQKKENLEFTDEGYIKFKRYPDGAVSNKLLHVWVAENQIYNAHKKFFSDAYPNMHLGSGGLEVHHIDYVKYNNKPENLAIISEAEHASIVHKEITNRFKGVSILKNLGIRQPHIPELKD